VLAQLVDHAISILFLLHPFAGSLVEHLGQPMGSFKEVAINVAGVAKSPDAVHHVAQQLVKLDSPLGLEEP